MPAKTLYELLQVRPNADAEALQSAFRDAAKANHPDLNPGDPDASRRFRQIFTAYKILRDTERRGAYDRMLAFERAQRRAVLTRKIVSGATGVAAALTILLIIGYARFAPVSKTSVEAAKVVEVAARERTNMTAVEPTTGSETADQNQPSARLQYEGPQKVPEIVSAPSAVTSASEVSNRDQLSGTSALRERADMPILPIAAAPVARSGEPSIFEIGGRDADLMRSNSAKAVVALDPSVGRDEARNGADDRGKIDKSNSTDLDGMRSGKSQLSLSEKDASTARSPPSNSAIFDERRHLRTTGKPSARATRTATNRAPVGQFVVEFGDMAQIVIDSRGAVGCAGSCSGRAPAVLGVRFLMSRF
jgi:curved DNA-binding protein CbpA